jgi:hypothetical protein
MEGLQMMNDRLAIEAAIRGKEFHGPTFNNSRSESTMQADMATRWQS